MIGRMRRTVIALFVAWAALLASASGAPSSVAAPGACAPGYAPCLPVVGDLDCGEISPPKRPVRVTGSDQYGIDRDGDGIACEDGAASPTPSGSTPGHIVYRLSLEKPLGTAVKQTTRRDKFKFVVWSPNIPSGVTKPFLICVNKTKGEQC